jgi:hypothetical protein
MLHNINIEKGKSATDSRRLRITDIDCVLYLTFKQPAFRLEINKTRQRVKGIPDEDTANQQFFHA